MRSIRQRGFQRLFIAVAVTSFTPMMLAAAFMVLALPVYWLAERLGIALGDRIVRAFRERQAAPCVSAAVPLEADADPAVGGPW